GNGATGTTGAISAANSLVGNMPGDQVRFGGVSALSNGSYVVMRLSWDNGDAINAGAATWGNGATGTRGSASVSNSLVGSTGIDFVGNFGAVTALANGNYVVRSPLWDNSTLTDVGAVTWGNGATGTSGVISATNSLIGSMPGDEIGSGGVFALSNG